MADRTYIAWSGTTAALSGTTTLVSAAANLASATAPKTMMQLKSSGPDITVVEWGYSFDVQPTALVRVELVDTGTVACTFGGTGGAALAAGDVPAYSVPGGSAASLTYSTSTSGFTGSGANTEGSVTATRMLAYNEEWGQSFKQQFPLGREPTVPAANYLRIRCTSLTSISGTFYVIFDQ